jgi:hypothetical protein
MANIDPFDIHSLVTPVSNDWPREVTPIPVRELENLRLKAEIRAEMDDRFDKVDLRFDKLESKQDENFQTLLEHVTRKSFLETISSNSTVMVLGTVIILVLALGYTQSSFDAKVPGADIKISAPVRED